VHERGLREGRLPDQPAARRDALRGRQLQERRLQRLHPELRRQAVRPRRLRRELRELRDAAEHDLQHERTMCLHASVRREELRAGRVRRRVRELRQRELLRERELHGLPDLRLARVLYRRPPELQVRRQQRLLVPGHRRQQQQPLRLGRVLLGLGQLLERRPQPGELHDPEEHQRPCRLHPSSLLHRVQLMRLPGWRSLAILALAATWLAVGSPALANPMLERGIRHLTELESGKAVKQLRRALRWSRNTPAELATIHLYLGIAHFNLQRPKEAAASFRSALKLKPEIRLPRLTSPRIEELFNSLRPGTPSPPPPPPEPPALPASSIALAAPAPPASDGRALVGRPPKPRRSWPAWTLAGVGAAAPSMGPSRARSATWRRR
jgi:tetratricopeptide (TPR) repeat protein